MTTKYYVTSSGSYIGGFDGAAPPSGSIEVPTPPVNASQTWNGSAWSTPPNNYQLSKVTAWRRMTTDEAQQLDAVMMETDAQMRQIYLGAQYLYSGDDLWTTLWGILVDLFGQTRTAQILAPET